MKGGKNIIRINSVRRIGFERDPRKGVSKCYKKYG
jgi:hypothetical protein